MGMSYTKVKMRSVHFLQSKDKVGTHTINKLNANDELDHMSHASDSFVKSYRMEINYQHHHQC